MKTAAKRKINASPLARRALRAGKAAKDAAIERAKEQENAGSLIDENQKFIVIADCRQAAAIRVAEFLWSQGELSASEEALRALASCFAWAHDTQAHAHAAADREAQKPTQSVTERRKRRTAYIVGKLRRVAPGVSRVELERVASAPGKYTGGELGVAIQFSVTHYLQLGGIGSIRPYDVSDDEYEALEKARRARARAAKRASRTPEEVAADRLADRERKMRKGREGAGTKLIADECGVSEQSVRDWKRHPKGLRWNVERKISKSRSDRLFKRLSDPDFGLFPSLEKRASRDGKKPKLVREPGRASSPSRPTSPARGAVTASQSNIIELGDRARRIIGKVGDASARAVAAIRLKKGAKQ